MLDKTWLYWAIAAFGSFLIIEIYAIATGKKTLSRKVWELEQRSKLFWLGILIFLSWLAIHFLGYGRLL